jgi:ribonuclease HI
LAALKWILDNKDNYQLTQVNFFADSQLMIRQLQGIYKVKSPNLVPIFAKAQKLITEINLPIKYQDIRRDFNKLADELANQAMDRKS